MKKILVIRKDGQFSRILAENDFQIINLPLIETKPLDDLSEFKAKLEDIEDYDGIFLTSRQAAQILAKELRQKSIKFVGKIYVLGKRSFEVLGSENLNLFFDESANTAWEMLDKIPAKDLKGGKFLFVRGEKSLRVVPDFLSNTATVDEAIVYQTREIKIEPDKLKSLREKFANSEILATCFFSPSGAESFIEQFGAEILHQTVIATIGKTTAEFFESRNFKVDFISPKATAEDFAVELIKYLGKEN